MSNSAKWKEFVKESSEEKFDSRLIEKKIQDGFLSLEEVQEFKKSVPEESEFDFSSAEELENASE